MVLISKNFLIENLSVRFAIPVISVILKNSAAVTNTPPGCQCPPHKLLTKDILASNAMAWHWQEGSSKRLSNKI